MAECDWIKLWRSYCPNIHAVVYDSSKAIPAINGFLKKENPGDFVVNKIPPSLEDVFVSLIENYDQTESEKS